MPLLGLGSRRGPSDRRRRGAPGSGSFVPLVLLDLAHAVPLAGVLGSLYGAPPIDLGAVFGAAAGALPAAPVGVAVAHWLGWLGRCDAAQLGVILDALSALDWQRTEAARAYLAQARAVESGSFGALPLVVVDRRALVDRLGEMARGERRILRVDGERGAGKSYTARITRAFLGASCPAGDVLVEGDCSAYALPALVEWLLRCLRGDAVALPTEGDTTRVRWIEQLAEIVVQEATSRPERTAWLALDRCSLAAGAGAELGLFLRRLAEVVEEHAASPRGPRLVLLECPSELTARRRRSLVEERIAPVVRSDIQEFLAARRFPPERAAALAAEVEAAMQAAAPAYPLEVMNERLAALVERPEEPRA